MGCEKGGPSTNNPNSEKGGPSKKKQKVAKNSSAARRAFDNTLFTSIENSDWYTSYVGNRLIVEKSISKEIDAEVPQFYANRENKENEGLGSITTFVKGLTITSYPEDLAELLGVPDIGRPVCILSGAGDKVYSDVAFSFEREYQTLRYVMTVVSNRMSVMTNTIPMLDHLISYFISGNIAPRNSATNELRLLDTYLIHKMIFGLEKSRGFPWRPL